MLFKPDDTTNDPAAKGWVRRIVNAARRRVVSVTVLAVVVAALTYLLWPRAASVPNDAGGMMGRGGGFPVPVLAATPRIADVPVYLDGVGAARALNTVTVRAQVDGKLLAVRFKEGQDVARGDVLAEIDPVLYKAQLDQALAKKAQDEAQLANARLDLARYQKLAASNAGPRQQADTAAAQVAQLEALVKADQAAIDNAQATLGYTKIVAPIAGRTGLRLVDEGNLVRASDTTGLVVITQIKPIAVQFSLPQQELSRVNAAFARGALAVDVLGSDGKTPMASGLLQGIDNQVDQATGTVKLKAEFANADMALWPGQFVNVRLKVETLTQATVIPTAAVQRGPAGTFVYAIDEKDVVAALPVTVVLQNDTDAVIGSGLAAEARVVTTGFANLADGSKVNVGTDANRPSPDLAPKRRQPPAGGGAPNGGPGQRRPGGPPR